MATDENQEKVLGCLFWLVVLVVAVFYWSRSDGIHSVKNMTIKTMIHDEITQFKGWDFGTLRARGIDIDKMTFQEALNKTSPSKIEWASDSKVYNGEKYHEVTAVLTFDPPRNNVVRMAFTEAVKKDHFWNINPAPGIPTSVTIVYKNGKEDYSSVFSNDRETVAAFTELFKK